MTQPACPIIELHNISVVRNNTHILDSLSFKLFLGENIVILGPNGSGKSTLIKIITHELNPVMTDIPPTVQMWGNDQWNVFSLRSKMGIVSNDLQAMFSRNISGREVILSGYFSSIGLFNHQITDKMEKKGIEISQFLGISHLMDRSILKMSSGEVRRFLIGRALIHSPDILILDEPTNNLDLFALHTLRSYLRIIAATGISIILITHNLHDIIPEINRVLLMKKGRIVADGPKEEIITEHQIGDLFSVPVRIHQENGYFFASGY